MIGARRRGQPLLSLAVLLVGWVAMRAAIWEPPASLDRMSVLPDTLRQRAAIDTLVPSRWYRGPPVRSTSFDAATTMARLVPRAESAASLPPARPAAVAIVSPRQPVPANTPQLAAAHQFLLLAALSRLPLPASLATTLARPEASPAFPAAAPFASPLSRFSGDFWVVMRSGSGGLAAGGGTPAYGASQAGGVLRFALVPTSGHAPQAFVRVSRALGRMGEREAAAGLTARPMADVPLRLAGEARVQRSGGTTRVRPAITAITELAPARLPMGFEAEVYGQAGYVGGKGATPFFDAQATADRAIAASGPAELRLGAGAWSGGQDGAARLDIGPRASVRLRSGDAASRIALDWRFRVAGDARPASGPALTISAGF